MVDIFPPSPSFSSSCFPLIPASPPFCFQPPPPKVPLLPSCSQKITCKLFYQYVLVHNLQQGILPFSTPQTVLPYSTHHLRQSHIGPPILQSQRAGHFLHHSRGRQQCGKISRQDRAFPCSSAAHQCNILPFGGCSGLNNKRDEEEYWRELCMWSGW